MTASNNPIYNVQGDAAAAEHADQHIRTDCLSIIIGILAFILLLFFGTSCSCWRRRSMNRLLPGFSLAIFLASVAASATSWCELNNSGLTRISADRKRGQRVMDDAALAISAQIAADRAMILVKQCRGSVRKGRERPMAALLPIRALQDQDEIVTADMADKVMHGSQILPSSLAVNWISSSPLR